MKDAFRERILELDSEYDFIEIEPKIMIHDELGNEYFIVVHNTPIFAQFESYKEVREYITNVSSRTIE